MFKSRSVRAAHWEGIVPAGHDYGEADERYDGSEDMYVTGMCQDEGQLVHGAPMADVVSSQLGQAQLGHQLLDKDDETNGRDETAQEWF